MTCNRCGKVIEETEIFCRDCKKHLNKFSSKKSVEELEELIEEHKTLTDLENTKELVNLDKLVEEEMKESLENKTQIFKIDEESKNTENVVEDLFLLDDEPIINSKKNNKKLIIIFSIVFILCFIIAILLFIFLGKEKEEPEKINIDYSKVINTYGDKITDIVKEYLEKFDDIPTWQFIIDKLDYDRYEVKCSIHNIYKDGSIYLSACTIDNKKTKVEYGNEQEEIKEGKKIEIYKQEKDGILIYSDKNVNSNLIGTITCKTEDCRFAKAFDKYVLIEEENYYYLYDYTTSLLVFGPFELRDEIDILDYNNTLYGILYKEENKNNIYNVITGKILKNVKGTLLYEEMNLNPKIMYKYNYVIFNNNGVNEFVNLKTGNVSYKIKETISSFIEKEKIVYITAYTSLPSSFKIYNSNGKELFEGKYYNKFIVGNSNLSVSTKTTFKVYDMDLNLKMVSKEYDEILGLYDNYVVALKENDLLLLNNEDELLDKIEGIWVSDYSFDYMASGPKEKGVELLIEDYKTNKIIRYFYDFNTKKII